MANQVFTSEALTDGTAATSNLFPLSFGTRAHPKINLTIGNVPSSADDDNLVVIDLYHSPNYATETDKDDATWILVPSHIWQPIRLLVGGTYAIGAIDSGDEFQAIREVFFGSDNCKLVAQRLTIGGSGTNTVTINAWIES